MKTANLNKGQNMLRTKSISVIASIALLGGLGLSGCGENNEATASSPITQQQDKPLKAIGTSVVEGRVQLDTTPTNRTVKSTVDATSQIVAYNMNDNTQYSATSNKAGYYTLSGLTEGKYQIVASSTHTTLRSVRSVEVSRDTRQTVNVVLQAAGSIKGKILDGLSSPSMMVYIPGTSYMSTVDKDGNFELVNVPVGKVTLFFSTMGSKDYQYGYDEEATYYTKNVSVQAGKVTSLPSVNPFVTTVTSVDDLQSDSTLELKHSGIGVRFNSSVNIRTIASKITLKDENGTSYPIKVSHSHDLDNNEVEQDGYPTSYIVIGSQNIVPAGTYTLTINTAEPYTKTLTLKDKLAVWEDSYTDGMYYREVGLAFPGVKPDDINVSEITITGNNGSTFTPTLKKLMHDDNAIGLSGDFKTGVTYTVALSGKLANTYTDGIVYVGGDSNIWSDGLRINGVGINYTTPYDGQKDVSPDNEISFSISHAEGVDLATVKALLNGKEYTIKNGGLVTSRNSYNDDWGDNRSRYFRFKAANLDYNSDYNLTLSMKDAFGNAIKKTTTFTTITPKIVGMLPYNSGDSDDILDNLDSNAPLEAYFNVPVDANSGVILLHDDTNNKDIKTKKEYQTYINNTSTPYNISFNADELLPDTKYTMSVTGFTANGYKLTDTNTTFTTPSRQFVGANVENGDYLRVGNLNEPLSFQFYGKLSDSEKQDIVDNLKITSFNLSLPTDKSHPVPLALWDSDENNPYGETLYLSFTLDDDTSYEIKFDGTTAGKLNIPDSKLTFMTTKNTPSGTNSVEVINNMYVSVDAINPAVGYNDGNLSALQYQARGSVDLTIPRAKDDYYSSDKQNACYNGDYDLNTSEISTWLSGTDLNITSQYAYNSWDYSGGYYDQNGNYHGGEYRCNVEYSASFILKTDNNSSVTVNIPQDALGDGFQANELNKTVKVIMPNPADYNMKKDGSTIEISFNSPVFLNDLNVTTNPLNIFNGLNPDNARDYDENGTKYYDKRVHLKFDTSVYNMFKYNIQGKVPYYDIATHTVKTMEINETGINFTEPDLTPLSIKKDPYALNANQIAIGFNSAIDIDTVLQKDENGTVTASAFTLTDEDNNTIAITDAYNQYSYDYNRENNYLELELASDLNTSKTYTLEQTKTIKKLGSTQALEAGSINKKVDLTNIEE